MVVTPKGRRTEAAFHDAARQVFAEKGYLNAKIADIAERAGRSTGSFYNYYDNKQQLLEALLQGFGEAVMDRTRAQLTSDPASNIEQAVRVYLSTYREYLPEMIAAFQMSMTDEQFAQWWRRRRADGIGAVMDVVRSVEKRGLPVDLDHGVFASAMVSMLESFCWTWFVAGGDEHSGSHDDEVAVATLSEIWRRALYNGR
ncbi:TetR/AcrR family transcriptional regulator [Gordonia soli]|uniref:Putative TetR family transcriptional regulator n=1 Tax=Gordonia soli NBRC 108243 TaxID=1223545 RepID=M0QCD0_9ACTN|nr:TetR/AcrR family transcriptional regulator [Gordonia soli]GAC66220.1 putative TetR family transcriptional regulator [Gordonia soli NBRC 108243]